MSASTHPSAARPPAPANTAPKPVALPRAANAAGPIAWPAAIVEVWTLITPARNRSGASTLIALNSEGTTSPLPTPNVARAASATERREQEHPRGHDADRRRTRPERALEVERHRRVEPEQEEVGQQDAAEEGEDAPGRNGPESRADVAGARRRPSRLRGRPGRLRFPAGRFVDPERDEQRDEDRERAERERCVPRHRGERAADRRVDRGSEREGGHRGPHGRVVASALEAVADEGRRQREHDYPGGHPLDRADGEGDLEARRERHGGADEPEAGQAGGEDGRPADAVREGTEDRCEEHPRDRVDGDEEPGTRGRHPERGPDPGQSRTKQRDVHRNERGRREDGDHRRRSPRDPVGVVALPGSCATGSCRRRR
jgi:hypothetical protein